MNLSSVKMSEGMVLSPAAREHVHGGIEFGILVMILALVFFCHSLFVPVCHLFNNLHPTPPFRMQKKKDRHHFCSTSYMVAEHAPIHQDPFDRPPGAEDCRGTGAS